MKFCNRISICSMPMRMYLHVILISSVHFHLVQVNSLGNETDRLALLHFKESITGDPLGILNSWNSSVPHCSWFGVTCNIRHRRVAALILKGHKLLGPISPHVGNLSFLRLLDLGSNSFHGEIPQQVGKLFRLHELNLENNTLEGEIPGNLTSCSNLEVVSFQGNSLSGKIPPQLGSLVKLWFLALGTNSLTGTIPSSLGNLTSLQQVSVAHNKLVGEIPGQLRALINLFWFIVGGNNLSGVIPPFLFNISSIEKLSFTGNKFHGELPDKGFNLPNLREAYFGGNQLSGKIPSSLTNASQLQRFDISNNSFVGSVPSNIGDLSSLGLFNIMGNNLGRNSTDDLDFLASLASCRKLEIIGFSYNNFGGVLPDSVANLSDRLIMFLAGSNQIYGKIPASLYNLTNMVALELHDNHLIGTISSYIGNMQNLQLLSFSGNMLSGRIPSSIGNMQNLQLLRFSENMLSGRIPSSIGNLSQLSFVVLYFNNLEGVIPSSIGMCRQLNYLSLDSNNLTGQIPNEILSIPSLSIYLGLSSNHLSGHLPVTIGKLTTTNALNISYNLMSGEIPSTIDGCVSLEALYMQGNFFRGEIPEAMASLKGLEVLDLSQNNLTGKIPKALQNLTYLKYFNISFNDLEGEVPTGGVFGNASAIFLAGNTRLCGVIPKLHLPKCPTAGSKKEKNAKLKLPIVIGCLLLFVAIVAVLLLLFWKKRSKPKPTSSTLGPKPHIMVSYKNLHDATNGFSSQNLLGYGSFGTVYKGLLDQEERPVAIKVLNLQQQGAAKSIIAECNALSNIRHRNLVKLVTYCSSLDYKGNDFKALVFEFMPNGSLENWLHPEVNQPRRLDIQKRLNIAIEMASALHYLHDFSEVPIIHRDLKPSNVLLDDDMVAHVGDFGLAKFLSTSKTALESQTSTLAILGTTGYVAPEYGVGAPASKEADIYSYGILLLEMFSGRRPTDDTFTDGFNLVDFIKEALPDRALQVSDPVFLKRDADETEAASSSAPITRDEEEGHREIELVGGNIKMRPHEVSCLTSVLDIGVACSEESPSQRPNLGDVLRKLHKVKDAFMRAKLTEDRRRSRQPRDYYYR